MVCSYKSNGLFCNTRVYKELHYTLSSPVNKLLSRFSSPLSPTPRFSSKPTRNVLIICDTWMQFALYVNRVRDLISITTLFMRTISFAHNGRTMNDEWKIYRHIDLWEWPDNAAIFPYNLPLKYYKSLEIKFEVENESINSKLLK